MSREPSPEQKRALKIWLKDRTKKPKEIAEIVGVSPELVRKWKSLGRWEQIPEKRPRGGQRGNKNAKGNKGGSGAPPGNDRAVKHGLFRKFMPQDGDFLEIMDMVAEMEPLDMLWQNIITQFTAIIRAPAIMHVTAKDEMIKEIKKQKFEIHSEVDEETGQEKPKQMLVEEEFEFQFSWDRYATFLKAQSVAMAEFRSMVKQFMTAAPENDERRAKLELMQAQIDKAKVDAEKARAEIKKLGGDGSGASDDGFMDALKGKAAEVWSDGGTEA
ncbi:phage terminase small subunit [Cohnella lubricantis]|uniref:PBSX phage terminase small subunit-like N-terminal domain-containing protein n=1 Tax=Cohnella lubricantis TaxID=2163172 RepID=A0A841TBW0_9BACL|nr:phage terminase small subunit [Cohnella lubricantis]MBB6676497.1 hypothetical protein [Cohnella lubricantis]MBP2117117.1 uncharacterized protein YjcR [Cohnella lubricantis]